MKTAKRIFITVLRTWWIAVLCAAAFGFAAYVYAEMFIPKTYTAFVTVYVRDDEKTGADTEKLTDTCIYVLQSEGVLDDTAKSLSSSLSVDDIREMLTVSRVPGTDIIKLNVCASSPTESAAIANTAAECAAPVFSKITATGTFNMIEYAKEPKNPSAPDLLRIALYAAVCGALLGIAGIAAVLHFDKRIKYADELGNALPTLGIIPEFDSEKSRNGETRGYYLLDENSPFDVKEAYKTLRTDLIFTAKNDIAKHTVLFTGTDAYEGKTSVCVNTAVSFAGSGKKVLLIDADMRKPQLHAIFGVKQAGGLSEYLAELTDEPAISDTGIDGLSLITSGTVPPSPSELLLSERTDALLRGLSEKFDFIFIDTPPVCTVTDASVISGKGIGAVLVARRKLTKKPLFKKAQELILLGGGSVIGFVFNDAKRGFSIYGGYGYGYAGYEPHKSRTEKKTKKSAKAPVDTTEIFDTVPDESLDTDAADELISRDETEGSETEKALVSAESKEADDSADKEKTKKGPEKEPKTADIGGRPKKKKGKKKR